MTEKTALITGSTGGIGKYLVSSLKEDVTVVSPTRKELDLSSNSSINNYISSLDIPIDIIVNCAGIHKAGNCEDLTEYDFQNVLQINLIAPFQIISGLAKGMKERKYGRILNISSIWSVIAKEKRSIYSASKSGLDGLTRTLALELAPFNILVNSIAPGYVDTKMIQLYNSEKELEKIKKIIPLGRFAKPSEIGELAKFLCSEKNSYITGQIIPIDGGYTTQ
ncbi:MAG: SDR family oxidoreductase [Thaumarchaeota archaeon]|nr:SDR family oxidoreductase [Nitrososphaerota archaeon]